MNETTDATAIFAPIWRRKWLILAVGVIVGVASYFYYKNKQHIYQGSTQVYLGASAEEQLPGEKSAGKSATATIASQATIINAIVVEQVHKRFVADHKVALVKGASVKAKVPEKSQFIVISAEAHTARAAALLANATARAYIARQTATRQALIEKSIAIDRRQLRRIELASVPKVAPKAATQSKSATPAPTPTPTASSILQEASLSSQINKLEASLTLPGAQQIKPATGATATLLSPKPRQNAIFGFVIGLVLAAIAAYMLSRFDRRLRSLAGIEAALPSPILTALPQVRRPIVRRDAQPTPSRFLVEPVRRLHTALQLGGTERATPRVILFLSPDAGDGKSTLAAELALIKRDAGQRVAIVEANLRRPAQARLLDLNGASGLADVLEGRVSLEQAMQRVHPTQPSQLSTAEQAAPVATAVALGTGSLLVLTGGGPVANPPALLASPAMAELLGSLGAEFDSVLIDAPSPLEVSDVLPLLQHVDGVLVVARAGQTRELSADRFVQLLGQSNVPVLGTVANCVPRKEIERYGLSPSNGRVGKLMGR
jgi:Mrp family chromosome partitioning ATPase